MSSQPHVQSFDLLLVSEREGRKESESMLHPQTRHLASYFSKTGVNSSAYYSFKSSEFHTNWKTFYNHLHSNWSMLCYRVGHYLPHLICPYSLKSTSLLPFRGKGIEFLSSSILILFLMLFSACSVVLSLLLRKSLACCSAPLVIEPAHSNTSLL